MTARTPPASDTATRARRAAIAAEVRAALDALERALVAGAEVPDDLTLQMIIDDLGVVANDLALVDRDLREHGQ